MNMRHCSLQDRKTTKRTLPYDRQYVILAIYEVLDKTAPNIKRGRIDHIIGNIGVRKFKPFFRIGEQAGGRYRIIRNDGQTVRGIVGIRRATSYNSRSRQHIAIS